MAHFVGIHPEVRIGETNVSVSLHYMLVTWDPSILVRLPSLIFGSKIRQAWPSWVWLHSLLHLHMTPSGISAPANLTIQAQALSPKSCLFISNLIMRAPWLCTQKLGYDFKILIIKFKRCHHKYLQFTSYLRLWPVSSTDVSALKLF